ncbi:MAG: histidine kinase, partial [Comamonadaceae bacterium]
MEMIVGSFHAVFPMGDASRVGEARRHAAELAHDCGFDETTTGRLALVVTELGTNLLRHATAGGRLLLSARRLRGEVEVIAIDE